MASEYPHKVLSGEEKIGLFFLLTQKAPKRAPAGLPQEGFVENLCFL